MLKKIYRGIRLLPKRGKEPYVSFSKILGFYPYNITLYDQALLHKSSSIKLKDGRWINNERLEFLGDAILDAIVADIVFKEFEYKKEGFLTNMRSKIVQRETLNKLALEIGIDKLIKTSTRNMTPNTHMYGNALEALIGAIYLDQGYRAAKRFVLERLIREHLNIETVAEQEANYKSRLIEWSQKQKISVSFDLVDSFVDDNNTPIFKTAVIILGEQAGIGTGYSKKESQQKAAKEAFNKLQRNTNFRNHIFELHEEQQKLQSETYLTSEEEESSSEPENDSKEL
ncbi:ribonuclease III [Dysgonomonas sp. Marseille-P4677]|uniref:ribonuclease III n=1 Tax=Dysgonomonas sp. Marseille-P4677 TaxID=2364790 RepID=UPI00191485B6|nr:ribonuclease III [Dysgonomonas sp. Marseille-P4677]